MEEGGGLFVLRPALADLRVKLRRGGRRAASSDMQPTRVRFRVANAGPASAGHARFSLSSRATPLALTTSQGTCASRTIDATTTTRLGA